MQIKIRDAVAADRNYILNTWIKSYYSTQTGYKEDYKTFAVNHQRQIERLFNEGKLIVQVACPHDDDESILGFIAFGTDYTLHYLAVKETFKRLGVAKKLAKSCFKDRSEIVVSHWTKDIEHIKRIYKVNYNRYRFFQ